MKQQFFQRHKNEIHVTGPLFILGLALLVFALAKTGELSLEALLEKAGFAIIVAIIVRWAFIVFAEAQNREDVYGSSPEELQSALGQAEHRIWIHQAWLPGLGGQARTILDREVETRILLLSFHPKSPMQARIAARPDIRDLNAAKEHSAGTVGEFVARGKTECLKFCWVHHPGWIARIDSTVFWGFAPVDQDDWVRPEVIHSAPVGDPKATFWLEQFEVLWASRGGTRWSHDYDYERIYNDKLAPSGNVIKIYAKPGSWTFSPSWNNWSDKVKVAMKRLDLEEEDYGSMWVMNDLLKDRALERDEVFDKSVGLENATIPGGLFWMGEANRE